MSGPGRTSALIVFADTPAAADPDLAVQERAARRQRAELVAHLDSAGASSEVELSPSTPLPSLLVEGTERGLAECRLAPSVRKVLPLSDDVKLKPL